MSTMTDIQAKAKEAASWFETAKRDENDPESTFVRTKEGTPDWVMGVVYAGHGDFLPDDWRYQVIWNALEEIELADDPEDVSANFADLQVDAYTADRIAWLSSNLNRASYCNDAAEEYGHGATDIIEMIGWGQFAEAEEIYALVLRALEQS